MTPSSLVALALAAATFQPALPGRAWRFPEDHWAQRSFRNEWWYFTGHLEAEDAPGRRFGFQLTFFRVGVLPERPAVDSAWATPGAVMGHLAITDVAGGAHRFSEVLWREVPLLAGFGAHPDPEIAWARAPPGTPGRWTLRWNGAGFDLAAEDRARGIALALETRPAKPLVFQGPGGFSRKADAEGFASLYYGYTRLDAAGTFTLGERRWRVRGQAWMDREMGSSQLAPGQVGWDWWSLQLDDGRDLMLYRLRRSDGATDFASATIVAPDGTVRYLAPAEWTAAATRTWRSPETGAVYPAGWDVAVPGEGIALRVEPALDAQENVARRAGGLFYWEGAVRLRGPGGAEVGRGYVELTGYGERNRPPL